MTIARRAKTTARPSLPKNTARSGKANEAAVTRTLRSKVLPTIENGNAIPTLGEVGLAHFVPYLLNRISAIWNANMQEALRDFDMTTTKMRILAVLSVMPGLTINELSVHAVTEQSTMSRTLDALEEQNLIRRQARPDDMRVREIYITEEGRTLFETFWPTMYDMYSHLFDGIDEAELRTMIGTLHKVLHNIRKQNA